MILHHPLPPYVPLEVGLGIRIPLTDSLDTKPAPIPLLTERELAATVEVRGLEREDAYFLGVLLGVYQGRPFPRGSLHVTRLRSLFGREIVAVDVEAYDPTSWQSMLRVDLQRAAALFASFG